MGDVFVGEDNAGFAVDVAWSGEVVHCEVVSTLVLIDLEEKVFTSNHFVVG